MPGLRRLEGPQGHQNAGRGPTETHELLKGRQIRSGVRRGDSSAAGNEWQTQPSYAQIQIQKAQGKQRPSVGSLAKA